MASSKSILVIGAGVIGLCTAYYAALRGHHVTIVERGAEDHDCCSLGNSGMIVPSHFVPLAAPGMIRAGLRMMWQPRSPFYIRPRPSVDLIRWCCLFCRAASARHVSRAAPLLRDLHLASRACYEQLASLDGNDFGLVRNGLLMLCRTEQALAEESCLANEALRLGIPADVLDAKQTAALDPAIRMDIAGSVYFPRDCHLVPRRLMARLRSLLDSAGAAFVWNAEVSGWETNRHRIASVITNRGEYRADEYVLCAGSWSSRLTRQLGIRLPMQAGKGYSLTLSQPASLPRIGAILAEAHVAVTPMDGALRFGGTMEIDGLDRRINPRRVHGIIDAVPRYYPEFSAGDFAGVPVWAGLRPCSPDGLPYIGRTRAYKNLSIATGHAMLGISLAPVTGKLVSEIVSDERPATDIAMLSPDRYG